MTAQIDALKTQKPHKARMAYLLQGQERTLAYTATYAALCVWPTGGHSLAFARLGIRPQLRACERVFASQVQHCAELASELEAARNAAEEHCAKVVAEAEAVAEKHFERQVRRPKVVALAPFFVDFGVPCKMQSAQDVDSGLRILSVWLPCLLFLDSLPIFSTKSSPLRADGCLCKLCCLICYAFRQALLRAQFGIRSQLAFSKEAAERAMKLAVTTVEEQVNARLAQQARFSFSLSFSHTRASARPCSYTHTFPSLSSFIRLSSLPPASSSLSCSGSSSLPFSISPPVLFSTVKHPFAV
eukprot:6022293-Pleurochrysis_carterae.AAC.6